VFEQLEQKLEHLIFPQQQGQQQQPASVAAAAAAALPDPRVCPVCGGRLVLKPSSLTGGFIGCR
jgi:rubredoxin